MAFKFIINKLSIIIFSNYLSGIITTYKQHTMTLTLYYIARHISLQLVYYMLDIFISINLQFDIIHGVHSLWKPEFWTKSTV